MSDNQNPQDPQAPVSPSDQSASSDANRPDSIDSADSSNIPADSAQSQQPDQSADIPQDAASVPDINRPTPSVSAGIHPHLPAMLRKAMQAGNPDTFKFRVYPEINEGEIFFHYHNRFNDSWSDGGTYCQCGLENVTPCRIFRIGFLREHVQTEYRAIYKIKRCLPRRIAL